MSHAYLSIDVEDYYHLEYYKEKNRNTDYSMLDGLELFLDLCETESIPPNLFVLSDVVKPAKTQIERAIKMGGKIGLHGLDHKRPLTLSLKKFRKDTIKAKQIIEDTLGYELNGYRAACFSLNREYLDTLINMGFSFDSSYINFQTHPLYGYIDLDGFTDNQNGIFENKNFREYEMTLPKIFKKNLPVTGGAYFRILPYALVEALTKQIFNENKIASCGIEEAYNTGVINWKKPISCHLYPVRVKAYSEFAAVNYHKWDICDDACSLGNELKVPVYKFVKEALIRKFGTNWYLELEKVAQEHIKKNKYI